MEKYTKPLTRVVPTELRLEIYKKAVTYTENELYKLGHGLCLVLPCLLYNLENHLKTQAYEGYTWDYKDTHKAFPELTEDYLETIKKVDKPEQEKGKIRIEYLKQWIKNLEQPQ